MKKLSKKYLRNWLLKHPWLNPYVLINLGFERVITSRLRILPEFIIIGSEKCGTTTLYYYLTQHPAIISSSTKEVHYFDTNYHGLWWYRSHFPTIFYKFFLRIFNKKIVAGEATPYYIYHPLVAKRIFNDLPKIKLIVILRDPISRAYSQYHDNKRKGQENLTFEEAVEKENSRINGEKEKIINEKNYNSLSYWAFSYISKGIYHEQLKKWFRFFPKEQFLILDTHNLNSNPQKVINQVFSFLGLPDYKIKSDERKNVGKYEQMDLEVKKQLRKFFKPHNEELEKMLGIKFSWMIEDTNLE